MGQPHSPRPGSPAALDLVVAAPEEWWVIPLPDDRVREARIEALLDRQFRGLDDQPLIKAELRRDLREQASTAAAAGGRFLALSLMQVGPIPVTASLTTYVMDLGVPSGGSHVRDLSERMLAEPVHGGGGPTSEDAPRFDRAELPAGEVLRRVRTVRGSSAPAPLPQAVEVMLVDYWIEAPGHRGLGQLAFSTALTAWSEQLLGLFDAMAGSASWRPVSSAAAGAAR